MTFFVAPTQADPRLAKLSINGKADAIITNDSDFPMYIGPNGWDIMIKDVPICMKGDPISTCRLCTGQENIAELFNKILQLELRYSPFDSDETDKHQDGNVLKYSIFSGVNDPMIQACFGRTCCRL